MSVIRNQYIERCPHDKENPYAMINRDLIRDERLHPCTRWMLIYLLSMKDGWKICAKQIYEHCKGFSGCGRDKVYDWIDEAIEAGYMKREEWREGNLNRSKLYLSEFPKFKKSFPLPDPQDAEPAYAENQYYKNKHQESKDSLEKKEHKKEKASDESLRLAELLFSRIQTYFPKTKQPNFQKWATEIQAMHDIDKISWEDIEATIIFALEDSFWCRNIRSAETLRKQYDKLYAKMTPVQNSGTQVEVNREIAKEIKAFLIKRDGKNDMQIFRDKVFISFKNETVYFNMNSKEFEDILMKIYGVKKL